MELESGEELKACSCLTDWVVCFKKVLTGVMDPVFLWMRKKCFTFIIFNYVQVSMSAGAQGGHSFEPPGARGFGACEPKTACTDRGRASRTAT